MTRLKHTHIFKLDVGRHSDAPRGFGLALMVRKTKSGELTRRFEQRIRVHDRPTNVSLGHADDITLAQARDMALKNWLKCREGGEPEARSRFSTYRVGSDAPTFAQMATRYLDVHGPTWTGRTASIWKTSLEQHVYPRIGKLPVDKITTRDLLAFLGPLTTTKRETSVKVRQRVKRVLALAIAEGHIEQNPAGDALTAALPRNGSTVEHRKALPHGEVADGLRRIRASSEYVALRLALEFQILTVARGGEVVGALWSEIDLDAKTWTIPAGRMKHRHEHRVTLSRQALDVLRRARELISGGRLIFPSARGRTFDPNRFSKILRGAGLDCVAHGFRSSFRDWCGETGQPREVAEACLSHQVGNATERAYARSTMLKRRATLMQQWADYVSS